MILYFVDGHTAECQNVREGRKYIYFTAGVLKMKYRVVKATGEVQASPYWRPIKKMRVEY